jgi:hypothetical protein
VFLSDTVYSLVKKLMEVCTQKTDCNQLEPIQQTAHAIPQAFNTGLKTLKVQMLNIKPNRQPHGTTECKQSFPTKTIVPKKQSTTNARNVNKLSAHTGDSSEMALYSITAKVQGSRNGQQIANEKRAKIRPRREPPPPPQAANKPQVSQRCRQRTLPKP